MRPPPENALLQALQADMNDFGQGKQWKLLPRLMDDRGKSALLALDAFNLLSLELIQNQDCYAQDPPILESVFLKRRQLCLDIQTSALRNSASLAALLGTYEIEALPAEFPVALLWDEGPIASSICDVLLKLTGEVLVTLPGETCRLRLISLTLSKGTLAVSVTPGQAGKVNLNAESTTLEMKPEELIIFASHWEVKPELAFFAKMGSAILPTLPSSTLVSIEAQVRDTETVALEAPVPSIVMSGEEQGDTAQDYEQDGWQCAQCGEFNEKHRGLCGKCGLPVLAGEELSKDSAPEPLQELRTRRPTWKCRYCSFDNSETASTCQQCSKTNQLPEEAPKKGWTCEYCTLVNSEHDRICNACAKTRKDLLPPSPPPEEQDFWKCDQCGYQSNGPTDLRCYKCKKSRQAPTRKDSEDWVCPACQKDNYSFSRACRTCKAPKPTELQPEVRVEERVPDFKREVRAEVDTWRCEKCGIDVQGSRTYCSACYARKPATRDQETPKAKPQEDWKCAGCQHSNRPTRDICLICREPRTEPKEGWTCTQCGASNPDKETLCLGCYERKPESWTCGKCRTLNSDSSCKRCGSAKPEAAARDAARVERPRRPSDRILDPTEDLNLREEEPREVAVRGANARPSRALDIEIEGRLGPKALEAKAGFNQRSEPRALPSAAQQAYSEAKPVKSSYWNCSACTAMNLAMDKECYRCHKPKSTLEPSEPKSMLEPPEPKSMLEPSEPKPRSAAKLEPSEPKPRSAAMLEPSEPRPKARNANYWACEGCGAQNFKDDAKCYRCKVAKEGEREEPTAEASWTCGHCQAKNSERATYCSKCFKDRQERQVAERPEKATWLCKYCQEENTASSDRCAHCYRSSKADPEPRTKTCSSCGQPTAKELCPMCEREVKYRSPKAWTCPKCRISVSGNYCSRCYASKPRS